MRDSVSILIIKLALQGNAAAPAGQTNGWLILSITHRYVYYVCSKESMCKHTHKVKYAVIVILIILVK
jgi:hypothetical protein